MLEEKDKTNYHELFIYAISIVDDVQHLNKSCLLEILV